MFSYFCSHQLGKCKALLQMLSFRPNYSNYFFPRSSLYEFLAEYPGWPPGHGISELPFLINIQDKNFSGGQTWKQSWTNTLKFQSYWSIDPQGYPCTCPVPLFSKMFSISSFISSVWIDRYSLRMITLITEGIQKCFLTETLRKVSFVIVITYPKSQWSRALSKSDDFKAFWEWV